MQVLPLIYSLTSCLISKFNIILLLFILSSDAIHIDCVMCPGIVAPMNKGTNVGFIREIVGTLLKKGVNRRVHEK